MAGLTVGDESEWEGVKKDFVKSGASAKSRILAIQRLTKEYAVAMDEAEAVANRWRTEYREECRKAGDKFSIGAALKECSGRKNQ
jgi:hypothetical protein